jgi:hypothetical protein
LGFALGGVAALLLAGYFALTRVADHYLQEAGLARAIAKKTASILKAAAREDLKQRLVAAAEEQLGKGFLAPLLKPGKGLLELLKTIYP